MSVVKRFVSCLVLSAVVLPIAACGTDPGDRALSGAGIGGAAGVGAAVLGAPLIPALVVGGAVGAATGAFTSPNAINLDK